MSTVVLKVGTSSITDDDGHIDRGAITKVCTEIVAARAAGHQVVLVSSGAIAAGLPVLGLTARRRLATPARCRRCRRSARAG